MEAGGGWQGGPRGAGQGQAGRHLAGGHGPCVKDVPPLVISHWLLVILSSIIGHHLVFSVFLGKQEVRIVAGGASCAGGSYRNGADRGCCIGHCTGALKICTLGMSSIWKCH